MINIGLRVKTAGKSPLTNLTLADSVTEHHQLLRLPPIVGLVELHQEVLGGVLHVLDDLLVIVQPAVLSKHKYDDHTNDEI